MNNIINKSKEDMMTIEIFNNTVRERIVIKKLGFTLVVKPGVFAPKILGFVHKPKSWWSKNDHYAERAFSASLGALKEMNVVEAAFISAVTKYYK
jgi:hypothetical protein